MSKVQNWDADAKVAVATTVNGIPAACSVETRSLLVNMIRRDLRLTGTHVGCDTTQCGACTVLLNGRATKSCTALALEADGASIRTIEGVATDTELHPIQRAFHEHHGLQCGYCTPGMIMMALDILTRHPRPTEEQVRHDIEGNICRCTGYENIVKSIMAAGEELHARGLAAQDPAWR
ncbi:MAG: [2Fe-2S] binding domain protein [Paucimonas sp.]|nr:[2Fe-2S] binding domain protein [Paucimonas sp.]